MDTMEDMIVDAFAAAIVAFAGYKANKRKAAAERNIQNESQEAR